MSFVSVSGRDTLAVEVRFTADQALIAPRGEIDLANADDLGAVLDAVIDRGPRQVIVDLSQVSFLDARGIGVLAAGAARIGPAGRLSAQGARPIVSRVIAVTGLDQSIDVEPLSDDAAVVALQPLLEHRAARDILDTALETLLRVAGSGIRNAELSITLWRQGQLTTAAATHETVIDLDRVQYATGRGPCVDAASHGKQIHAPDLSGDTDWSSFAHQAAREGFRSVLSSPIHIADRPIGALNMYSRDGRNTARALKTSSALTAELAHLLSSVAHLDSDERDDEARLAEALRARDTLTRAEGILMAREHLSVDEAFTTLRHLAADRDIPVSRLAAEVLASTLEPPAEP